jgi:adenine-specific DNA-methyltransferase
MGDHARTHCVPRLEKVIAGEQGGISVAVAWQGGGGFTFCTLGEPIFDKDGRINPAVGFDTLAADIWHIETGAPAAQAFERSLLGINKGTAYYLLFDGILGDRIPAGGNVLNDATLAALRELHPREGPMVVFGETSRLNSARLDAENITFKPVPHDERDVSSNSKGS